MSFTYPKEEKLKRKKIIDSLFVEGKSVSKYPLRLVYVKLENEDKFSFQIGVSVSKKNFKKAVDRNYFKRLLREAYRLNQHILKDNLNAKYAMMFFYQTKERLDFHQINLLTIQLFEKFIKNQE